MARDDVVVEMARGTKILAIIKCSFYSEESMCIPIHVNTCIFLKSHTSKVIIKLTLKLAIFGDEIAVQYEEA